MKLTTKKRLEIVGLEVLGILAREYNRDVRNCGLCEATTQCDEHRQRREALDNFRSVVLGDRSQRLSITRAHHRNGSTDGERHVIKKSFYQPIVPVKRRGRPRKYK